MKSFVILPILFAVFYRVQAGTRKIEPKSINFAALYKSAEDALAANTCKSIEWNGFKNALIQGYFVGGECLRNKLVGDEQTACLFALSVNVRNDLKAAVEAGRNAPPTPGSKACLDKTMKDMSLQIHDYLFLDYALKVRDMREFVSGDESKQLFTAKPKIAVCIVYLAN